MTLQPGTRLGPYEILAPLGAGGMGEVYRAVDSKLGREVAVKVLPAGLAGNPEALARFESEARAVAQLSHPNILAIHDFGWQGQTAYAVMELLAGETLRARLEHGALPARKAVDSAVQMAKGLAAAHDKGIVHRDLKPENVFVTGEGHVKLLDFGLAKRSGPVGSEDPDRPTDIKHTGPGTVLGTAGYMSPEQVRGEAVDHRSDIFSFGAVLYEMLTGQRAFGRETAAESMTAILKEDPPEIAANGSGSLPALERIVRHCLEKRPGERFQSARDLGFALENSTGVSGDSIPAVFPEKRRRWGIVVPILAGVLLACLAYLAGSHRIAVSHPVFRPLTRERGTLGASRFVPGTSDVAYSARWGSGASRLYVTRMDQPAPRVLPDFEGLLQSVSSSGEILGLADPYLYLGMQHGRLISLPMSGGAARTMAGGVSSADQGQGGDGALVIFKEGMNRLEWPYGHEIARTYDNLRAMRIRGTRLAFFQDQSDTVEDGHLLVTDRAGHSKSLAFFKGFTGLAWGPDGSDLWVSTYNDGESRIVAVDQDGHMRTLLTHAGRLELQDVDDQGRMLAVVHTYQRQVFGRARGRERDEDLTWLEAQDAEGISEDGRQVLLAHMMDWTRSGGHIFIRPLDGGPAQDLGEGMGEPSLSPDGRWVASYTDQPVFSLKIIPTGPGIPRIVPLPDFAGSDIGVNFLPDSRHAIVSARLKKGPYSLYWMDLGTGKYHQVAPDGASGFHSQNMVSPDGQWMAYETVTQAAMPEDERSVVVARTDGSSPRSVHGLREREAILGWYKDSSALVILDRNVLPAPVTALDVATGKRTPLMMLTPPDPVGISGVQGLCLAPDGSAYAYNIVRQISELYLIEGLK